ncbi:MAG: ATP-binding protein [Candidatus Magnetomorum sp.]|nr:ATP-binding protein [Candidatus Magnetomorum sp.]
MERKISAKLLEWKSKDKKRMPLIISGARQVGKTHILREFGRNYYKNSIYVNLETNLSVSSLFENDITPDRIIRFLEASFNEAIIPDETLIILDEIQFCERALTSLKYFCEDANEYHVVAAGSLLGVAINREKYSFPVGKVETITLYPMNFEEFLWALQKDKLANIIRENFHMNRCLPEVLHLQALELYKIYLIVGGMPAAVKRFVDTEKIIEIADIQSNILNSYIADMAKYAINAESVKIRAAYNSLPNQLAKNNKKFQYKVIQKGGNANLFGSAIEWLIFSGIVLKCQKIEKALMPLAVYTDLSSFKLYMADTGLLVMKSGLAYQTVLSNLETDNIFLGSLAENYVAQELSSNGYPLFYWESKGMSEIDFLLQNGEQIIPVEVKAGTHTRSKSLSVFVKKYRPNYSIRISAKNFGFENQVKSVPLYAVYNICLTNEHT